MKNFNLKDHINVSRTQSSTVEVPSQLMSLVSMFKKNDKPWAIKNSASQYMYANDAYLSMLNLTHKFNIEGRSDGEIPHSTAEFALYFQQHDRKVQELKRSLSSLDIYPYGSQQIIQPYLCEKFPYDDGEDVKIIVHADKYHFFSDMFFINRKLPHSLVFSPPENLFTRSELDVLFLAMRRMKAKEIGRVLSRSHRTVENKLRAIYRKTGIHFLGQLIEFCQTKGFDRYVPPRFLRPCSLLLDCDDTT